MTMHMQKPALPTFEQAMELLHHAEGEILRGEAQARVFIAVNAAAAALATVLALSGLPAGGPATALLFLSGLGAIGLGCWALLLGAEGGPQMKDARQALYLDAIGARDTYPDFLRTFQLLSASPGERVLHAVYLRSIWAKRKGRVVRALGTVTLANLALAAVAGLRAFL